MSFYEIIEDVTADTGIRVKGESVEEVFCKAILATFNEITDINAVDKNEEYLIELSGEMPYLLVDVINRALVLFESKGFVAKECHILELSQTHTRLLLKGGSFDIQKHEAKLLIKAATYHRLKLEKVENQVVAEVIFDI